MAVTVEGSLFVQLSKGSDCLKIIYLVTQILVYQLPNKAMSLKMLYR